MANTLATPDLADKLRTVWPSLSADQRQVVLDLVWTLAGPDSPLMDAVEDLEAGLAYDAYKGDPGELVPWEQVKAELDADSS